jgi:hypothetical protein
MVLGIFGEYLRALQSGACAQCHKFRTAQIGLVQDAFKALLFLMDHNAGSQPPLFTHVPRMVCGVARMTEFLFPRFHNVRFFATFHRHMAVYGKGSAKA